MKSRETFRRYAPLVGLLYVLLLDTAIVTSAPVTVEESVYEGRIEGGCYYMLDLYKDGEQIRTNEPCLNCTCANSMLMCYLKTCPFSKPIGSECSVERVSGQCCPIIRCPEVPVMIPEVPFMTISKPETTAVVQVTSTTAVSIREPEDGCFIDDVFYTEGSQVPQHSVDPCDLCYCIHNHTACVKQRCTLEIPGCLPNYKEGACCPVSYDCDSSVTFEPPTTTTTTTLPPSGCYVDEEYYYDGSVIHTGGPCEHCYCMQGKLVCAVQECDPPMEKCTPIFGEDQCCPAKYECPLTPAPEFNSTEGYFDESTDTSFGDDSTGTPESTLVPDHGAAGEPHTTEQALVYGSSTESDLENEVTDAQPTQKPLDDPVLESHTGPTDEELSTESSDPAADEQRNATELPSEVREGDSTESVVEESSKQTERPSAAASKVTAEHVLLTTEEPKPEGSLLDETSTGPSEPASSQQPSDVENDGLATESEISADESKTSPKPAVQSETIPPEEPATSSKPSVEHDEIPPATALDVGATDSSESEASQDEVTAASAEVLKNETREEPQEDSTEQGPAHDDKDTTTESFHVQDPDASGTEEDAFHEVTESPDLGNGVQDAGVTSNLGETTHAPLGEERDDLPASTPGTDSLSADQTRSPALEDDSAEQTPQASQEDSTEAPAEDSSQPSRDSTEGIVPLDASSPAPSDDAKPSEPPVYVDRPSEVLESSEQPALEPMPTEESSEGHRPTHQASEEPRPTQQPLDESQQTAQTAVYKPTEQPSEEPRPSEQPSDDSKVTEEPSEEAKPIPLSPVAHQPTGKPLEEHKPTEQPSEKPGETERPAEEYKPTAQSSEAHKPTEQPSDDPKSTEGSEEYKPTDQSLQYKPTEQSLQDKPTEQSLQYKPTEQPSEDAKATEHPSEEAKATEHPSEEAKATEQPSEEAKPTEVYKPTKQPSEEPKPAEQSPDVYKPTEQSSAESDQTEQSPTRKPVYQVKPTEHPGKEAEQTEQSSDVPKSTDHPLDELPMGDQPSESSGASEEATEEPEEKHKPSKLPLEDDQTEVPSKKPVDDQSESPSEKPAADLPSEAPTRKPESTESPVKLSPGTIEEPLEAPDSELKEGVEEGGHHQSSDSASGLKPAATASPLQDTTAQQDDTGLVPEAVPGEGDCLLHGVTFRSGQQMPNKDVCSENCTCLYSVVQCDRVSCEIPFSLRNLSCVEVFEDGHCCPRYICSATSEKDQTPPSSGSLVTALPMGTSAQPGADAEVTTSPPALQKAPEQPGQPATEGPTYDKPTYAPAPSGFPDASGSTKAEVRTEAAVAEVTTVKAVADEDLYTTPVPVLQADGASATEQGLKSSTGAPDTVLADDRTTAALAVTTGSPHGSSDEEDTERATEDGASATTALPLMDSKDPATAVPPEAVIEEESAADDGPRLPSVATEDQAEEGATLGPDDAPSTASVPADEVVPGEGHTARPEEGTKAPLSPEAATEGEYSAGPKATTVAVPQDQRIATTEAPVTSGTQDLTSQAPGQAYEEERIGTNALPDVSTQLPPVHAPEVTKSVPEVTKPVPEVTKPVPEVTKPVPEVSTVLPLDDSRPDDQDGGATEGSGEQQELTTVYDIAGEYHRATTHLSVSVEVENATHTPAAGSVEFLDATQQPQADVTQQPQEYASQQPQADATEQPQEYATQQQQGDATQQPQEYTTRQQGDATKQPQEEATQKPQVDVTPQPQKHVTQQPQADATQQPQEVSTLQPQQHVTQQRQDDATEQTQQYSTQQPQHDATQQHQLDVTQQPQQDVTQQPQQDVTQQPQQDVTQQPQQDVTQQPQQDITQQPQQDVTQQPQQDITQQPQQDVTQQSQQDVTQQPQQDVTQQPQQDITQQPQQDVTQQPQQDVTQQPQQDVTQQPQQGVTQQSQQDVTHQPQQDATQQPQQDVTQQPQQDVTQQPQQDVTQQPQQDVTQQPQQDVTQQSQQDATQQSQQDVTQQPQQDATQQSQQDVTQQSQQDVTQQPQQDATQQSQQDATQQSQQDVTQQPQQDVTQQSQQDVTQQPQQYVTQQPQQDATQQSVAEYATRQPQENATQKPLHVTESVSKTTLAPDVPESKTEPAATGVPQVDKHKTTLAVPQFDVHQTTPEAPQLDVQDATPAAPQSDVQEVTPVIPESDVKESTPAAPQVTVYKTTPAEPPYDAHKTTAAAPQLDSQEGTPAVPQVDKHRTTPEVQRDGAYETTPAVPHVVAHETTPGQPPADDHDATPAVTHDGLATKKPQQEDVAKTEPQPPATTLASEVPLFQLLTTAGPLAPQVQETLTTTTAAPLVPQHHITHKIGEGTEAPPHQPQTSTAPPAIVHRPTTPETLKPEDEYHPEHTFPDAGIPITEANFTLEEGECIYDSRIYASAQQIPRNDPCDFCFCFRGDIICLQQSCPPPIEGCHEEAIPGFCCPRYECPVTAVTLNVTDTKVPYPISASRFRTVRALTQAQVIVCEFRHKFYDRGEFIAAASGPCMDCICGEKGAMKCIPKKCQLSPFWQALPGFKKMGKPGASRAARNQF